MSRIAKRCSCVVAVLGCLLAVATSFGQVSSFQINVPQRTNPLVPDQYPIMKLKVIVQVNTSSPIIFSISDPWGDPVVQIGPLQPVNPVVPSGLKFFLPPGYPATPLPNGAINPSDVRIYPPDSSLPSTDPGYLKYVLLFDLNSDYNLGVSCTGTMISTETWTISLGATGMFNEACAQSLNTSITGTSCVQPYGPVPLGGTAGVATIGGLAESAQGCRPGVSAILVLDQSGSMASNDLGTDGLTKITALQNAVVTFVDAWTTIRTNESSAGGIPQITSPNDQIGVVLFDSTASWWSAIPTGLSSFATAGPTILSNVTSITPGSNTAIGQGLLSADSTFPTPTPNRQVVMLMTDGIQNTDPLVAVNTAIPPQIVTYPMATPASTTPLPNQKNYQVYATTVGTSTAVDPTVVQAVAIAGGGYYKNTETDASVLNTFFAETIQNFLQFSTQQTVRIISDNVVPGTPYKPAKGFPISTTSRSVIFNLTWNASQMPVMQLTVTPPGGGKPFVKSGSGNILLSILLPPPVPYAPTGDWNIQIDATRDFKPIRNGGTDVPFNLTAIADDMAVDSKLFVVPGDYAPGDPIKLQVNLSEFGQPITGSTVVATLIKPGTSIGDLLSASTASSSPSGSDPDTPAENKLANTLAANPSLLTYGSDIVTLYDDGKPEHGDAVAGDGIYSALYPSQLPGHYNVLFAAKGTTKNSGKFSRMQLQTVFVRPAPDSGSTAFQTSISGNVLTINMTPRTKAGDHMGPGWANYFWFTATGQTPFKAKDNLDGTYTATMSFTGSKPPQVSVHFLRIPMIIADSVTAAQLPIALGPGNVFVPNVQKASCWYRLFHGTVLLFLGAGVFLMGVVVYWPRRRRNQP